MNGVKNCFFVICNMLVTAMFIGYSLSKQD